MHNSINSLKVIELHTLKWVNFVVCQLYLSKCLKILFLTSRPFPVETLPTPATPRPRFPFLFGNPFKLVSMLVTSPYP